jgi:hypothetical protein
MRSAVNCSIASSVEVSFSIQNLVWLLRGGSRIQIDQPISSAHGAPKDRKIPLDALYVEELVG